MRRRETNGSVTIRDIAKQSGFSASTVSIVLNEAPLAAYIPPQTKQHIKQVARKLQYRPNLLARSLRSQRNHTIGLMVFDITDPFCTPIIRGIEGALYQNSYMSILADARNERDRFEHYLEMLLDRRAEGIVVVANWVVVDIKVLARLEQVGVPTVVIGRRLETASLSSVMVDNEAGARLALEHLWSLGHRSIAFIRGPSAVGDTAVRWKGIRDYARSVGLKIDPRLVVDLPNSTDPNFGFDAGGELARELLGRKRKFTALMAFDDVTALGAMRALSTAGARVPEDCSVIGFDDVAPAALSLPPLTTVRQPMETFGATAIQVLTDRIDAVLEKRQTAPEHRILPPELVIRRSTCKAS